MFKTCSLKLSKESEREREREREREMFVGGRAGFMNASKSRGGEP
jgi:hypothetical protein